jgi:hypothetical protein
MIVEIGTFMFWTTSDLLARDMHTYENIVCIIMHFVAGPTVMVWKKS